jgi:membrane associated rhomboid family serine protease
MGIYDRDYLRREPTATRGSTWRHRLPSRGAVGLLVLHVLGFVMVRTLQHDEGPQAVILFTLGGASLHPAAIALHVIGTDSSLTLALVLAGIWVLGSRIESRVGTGRLLTLYGVASLIGGVVYFLLAQRWPEFARYPLEVPVGGLAAWTMTAWRGLRDETFALVGRPISVARAVGIGAAVVPGWVFFRAGPDATAWLLAAGAGSLADPLLNLVRTRAGLGRLTTDAGRAEPGPRAQRNEPRPGADEPVVDEILAKISRGGLEALTPAERERLEAARRARQRPPA